MDQEATLKNKKRRLAPRRRAVSCHISQSRRLLMKILSWKSCLVAGVSCLMLFGNTKSVCSAQENPAGPDERLQRLEWRINELAERQDQMLRRLGDPQG